MNDRFDTAFVFPSAVLGGHEAMACAIIERSLQKGERVACFAPPENTRLAERLARLSVPLQPLPVRSVRLESMRALVDARYVAQAAAFLNEVAARCGSVVIVQGDIETGSVFLVAARRAGVPLVSYLPYCHSFHQMRKPLGRVRDLINRWVYRACPEYWVISATFASQLRRLHPRAQIHLRENFLPQPPRFTAVLERPAHEVHVIVVGRVYFPHKGQDLFLRALRRVSVPEGRWLVAHIVGDGLDLDRARVLAQALPARVRVEFHGWLERWWDAFSPRDVLVIPSRFEGVPLVMLEALSLGLRVVAPHRDGMADRLPPTDLYRAQSDRQAIRNLGEKLQALLLGKRD